MSINKKTIMALLGAGFLLVLFAWSLNNLQTVWQFMLGIVNVLYPLILGCVIAFVLNLPMGFFERHVLAKAEKPGIVKLRRALGIVISLIIIIAVILFITVLVIPEIGNAFVLLGQAVAEFLPQASEWITNTLSQDEHITELLSGINLQWGEIVNDAINYATTSLSTVLGGAVNIVGVIAGGITNAVLALIFAIYILMSKEKLKEQFKTLFEVLLPEKLFIISSYIMKMAKTTFSNFVVGQCAEAVILGVLSFAGMTLFGFPYATTISALVGVLALIPIVGAFLGAIVGAFLILMVDPVLAIWYIVFSTVLQQVEGNLIYPKVVGSSVGLPGMWVLAAVTIGGGLWGVVGMLVMVPLFSILFALVRLMVKAGKSRKAQNADENNNPKQAGSALIEAIVQLETEEQNNKIKVQKVKKPKKAKS